MSLNSRLQESGLKDELFTRSAYKFGRSEQAVLDCDPEPLRVVDRCCQSNAKLSPFWGIVGPQMGECPCSQSPSSAIGSRPT